MWLPHTPASLVTPPPHIVTLVYAYTNVCRLAKCDLHNLHVQKLQILRIKDRIHHKNINKLKNKWTKCDDRTPSLHCVIRRRSLCLLTSTWHRRAEKSLSLIFLSAVAMAHCKRPLMDRLISEYKNSWGNFHWPLTVECGCVERAVWAWSFVAWILHTAL